MLGHPFCFLCVAVENWPGESDPFVRDFATFQALFHAIVVHDHKEVL